MTTQIEAEQFSTASYTADSIESQVKTRFSVLNGIASRITPELIRTPGRLREFLHGRTFLLELFQTGIVVISKEGKGIADFPVLLGRSEASYTLLEYFKEVIATGKPSVGKPRISRFSKKPVVGFAIPVEDRSGQVIAVLAGFTLLSDPTLLGTIESNKYKGFPDRILVHCPKYGIHVVGSDPTRLLTPKAKPGVEPLLDRFAAGFEGSGITVNTRGVRILISAKQIPSTGWFVRVGLPIEMAFAPIQSMKNWAYSIALGLSLLSSLLVWLVIRQALRPLYSASKLINDITEERLPPQDIPVTQNDEVGQLLTSFNALLNYRKLAEQKLHESEEKFRDLFNNAEIGMFRSKIDGSEMLDMNQKFLDIVGRTRDETQEKPAVRLWADPKEREEMIRRLVADGRVTDFEYKILNKQSGVRNCLVSAVLYPEQDILEGSIVDITERKLAEEALKESHKRLLTVLNAIEAIVYVADMKTYEVLFINNYGKTLFGDIVGQACWKTIQTGQSGPCAFCSNDKLLDAAGNATGIYQWELQNTANKHWYDIRDRALQWIDGRIVRMEIATDITERKKAEELIKHSLKEKETLLMEIHHRVKNNMAVVSSLLSLQANKIKDATLRSLFEESKQRVKSMALVHEKLYQTKDLSNINFEDYIKSLISEITSLYRIDTNAITTEINIEDIGLDLESAVPCGLIINELLTNAFKYAFPDNRKGVLSINFTERDHTYTLTVKDNGVGMPEGFDYKETSTLGLQLVNVLTGQLNGTLQIKSYKGTEAVVTFKAKRD